jgi:hypothetical protein
MSPPQDLRDELRKEIRKRAVKPEDEPYIARNREVLEAGLRLAAVRKKRKKSQAARGGQVHDRAAVLFAFGCGPADAGDECLC